MTISLNNKSAILFGAGAIASGYAKAFREQGVHLALVSRGDSAQKLTEEIQSFGQGEIIVIKKDASDYEQVGEAYQKALKKFGSVEIVVNGAGGNSPDSTASNLKGFAQMDPQAPINSLNNNYLSKWYSIQHYLAYLEQGLHQGSVVNITSMSGFTPLSRAPHYAAAYAAVESLTRSMAYVFGHYQLGRINNVAVGFTIGEQNRNLLTKEDGSFSPRGQEVIANTSQHRFLSPAEIAPHVLYLADSTLSGAINGATLRVDGGYGLIGLQQTGYDTR